MSECYFSFQSLIHEECFADSSPPIHSHELSFVAFVNLVQFCNFLMSSNNCCHKLCCLIFGKDNKNITHRKIKKQK